MVNVWIVWTGEVAELKLSNVSIERAWEYSDWFYDQPYLCEQGWVKFQEI